MTVKLSVPHRDGEIVVATDGSAPRSYPVADGTIEVEDVDVAGVLQNVVGSARVEASSDEADAKPAQPQRAAQAGTGSGAAVGGDAKAAS